MTKLKTLAFATMLAFIGVSCDNSDDSTDPPIDQGLLIKQIITSNPEGSDVTYSSTATFNYTNGNVLTSIVRDNGNSLDFIYENGLLSELRDGDLSVIINHDNNNRLSDYTIHFEDGSMERYEFTYQSNGTIIEKSFDVDTPEIYYEFELIISNGQIVQKIEIDEDSNFTGITNFTYDTQNGVYKNIAHIETILLIDSSFTEYMHSAANNLLTEITSYPAYSITEQEFTYTYNAEGYPITADSYFDGYVNDVIEYIYE